MKNNIDMYVRVYESEVTIDMHRGLEHTHIELDINRPALCYWDNVLSLIAFMNPRYIYIELKDWRG